MDLQEKKLALFDAHLSHRGLQHLVDTAAKLLGNPIFMADMSMNIVFKSSDMGTGSLDYSSEGDLDARLEKIRLAADAGYFDWLFHHDEPIYGYFEGQPRYLAARVRDGHQVIGHAVVAESNRPFEPSDEQILPVICQTISFELRRTRVDDESSREYGSLLRELLAGEIADEDAARSRMAVIGHPLPPSMRVLLFRTINPSKTIAPSYLRSQLLRAFHGSMGIDGGEEEIHVIDGSLGMEEICHRISGSVYTGGIVVGASRPTNEATMIGWARRQADAAIRLSPSKAEGQILSYDNVVAQHIGEFAVVGSRTALSLFGLPELRILEEIDEKDGTDYIDSLAAYLNSGRNVARAAQIIHVHKNSMYNRIARMGQLTGLDYSDERTCFLAQLSLAMAGRGPHL